MPSRHTVERVEKPWSSRISARRTIEPLVRAAVGYSWAEPSVPAVLDRQPPFVVVGTADLGALFWCEAKGTFKQAQMEPAFATRALEIFEANERSPRFARPHAAVCALEVHRPQAATPSDRGEPAWAVAEREETVGAWCLAFVAALPATTLGVDTGLTVVVVGVTDGVRPDGTVVEVRQTGWTWDSLADSGEVGAKETQANLYAVMLGLPSWVCVFRCSDGRHETRGIADQDAAYAALARGVRFRAGLATPAGVPRNRRSRCAPRSGKDCEYLANCPHTPVTR